MLTWPLLCSSLILLYFKASYNNYHRINGLAMRKWRSECDTCIFVERANHESAICSVLLFLVLVNVATGQNSKHRSKYFQNYQVDTIHINGDPVAIKRNVIAIQHEEGIRSAFWDENDQTLTVEYDAFLYGLDIIRQYFINNLKARTIIVVVPPKL